MQDLGQHGIVARHAQKRAASHEHAGHRARLEGQAQALLQALRRGLRRAHIGADADQHAGVTRSSRQDGPDQEADRGIDAEKEIGRDRDDDTDDTDRRVLTLEIGRRAFLDRRGDFAHALIALVSLHQAAGLHDAVQKRENAGANRRHQSNIHWLPLCFFYPSARARPVVRGVKTSVCPKPC